MKFSWLLFLVGAALTATAMCATTSPPATHSLARSRRQVDFFANTRKLIEELISNLSAAAKQAKAAVAQFQGGLAEQVARCQEQFQRDLEGLRARAGEALDSLQDKLIGSSAAIGECIKARREAAGSVFANASTQMGECAERRLQKGRELVRTLSTLATEGEAGAAQAMQDMRNCSEQHAGTWLGVGACLGALATRTEFKGASFLMRSGVAVGRMNVFMTTLPAALQVCAGSSLVSAGVSSAKLLLGLGTCSTGSVLSTFGSATGAQDNAGSPVSDAANSLLATAVNFPSSLPSIPSSLPNIPSSVSNFLPSLQNIPSSLPNIPSSLPNIPSSVSTFLPSLQNIPSSVPDMASSVTNFLPSLPNAQSSLPNIPSSISDAASNVADNIDSPISNVIS